ncbi:MAG: hypothetical protein HY553_13790 [Elusimicrobia bacterium]|nr:hypothetical protein [Elusimicrobiota bacterium]
MIVWELSLVVLGLAALTVAWINEARPELGLPRLHPADLLTLRGTVTRGQYLAWGLLLFSLKLNIDRAIVMLGFKASWTALHYLAPGYGVALGREPQAARMFWVLAVTALPFVWAGAALTLQRLRSAGLPLWLVAVFPIPVVNLLFFLVLAAIPERDRVHVDERPLGLARWIPEGPAGAALAAIGATAVMALLATVLSVAVFKHYGFGLFVGSPFCQGIGAALLYGFHRRRGFWECQGVAAASSAAVALGLLVLAFEGAFCIAMAAPIGIAMSALGAALGYTIQKGLWDRNTGPAAVAALWLGLPGVMGMERLEPPEPPLNAVTTAFDIAAPPEIVWRHVVAVSELPPPTEFIFRHGVAFPIRATIEGQGPGAIRRCVFSTGDFVEPIEVWDAPRELRFGVSAQPASMREWNPFGTVVAPHLEGYFRSTGGRFRLIPLGDNGTRVEGTTWYHHGLWPAGYWTLWADAILHRIHLRVLRHIAAVAEAEGLRPRPRAASL